MLCSCFTSSGCEDNDEDCSIVVDVVVIVFLDELEMQLTKDLVCSKEKKILTGIIIRHTYLERTSGNV